MTDYSEQIKTILVNQAQTAPSGVQLTLPSLKYAVESLNSFMMGLPASEKDIRKHEMTGYLVDLLKAAMDHVCSTNQNDFKKGEIAERLVKHGAAAYGNFPQLRYFGLITHPEVDGAKQKRRWLITTNGGAFLRGKHDVRTWVKIKDNHIVERSEERANIYRLGHSPAQTAFEYYSRTTGKKTGIRPLPAPAPDEQPRLFDIPKKPAERPRYL